jgi:hypothetical protein
MALNWQLDEETEKHMNEAREDERKNPEPEPTSGPSTPAVTVEKEPEAPKPEVKVEEKPKVDERPRNPDGTFAKVKEDEPAKPVETAPEKPIVTEQPEKMVSLNALHEERERRKELQRKMEAMEKRWGELVEKIGKPAPQPAPDPSQDFAGYTIHQFQQVQQQQQALGQKVQSFEEWQKNQAEEGRFQQAYFQAAQDYAANQKDFPQAYGHWLKSRLEELTDAGYTRDQAIQIRTAEEKAMVMKAFEDGVNPAQRIYTVAQRRGYTIPSVPEVQPAVDQAAKLKQIAEAQRATPALGGGGMKPKLTLQGIAQMSDEEFSTLDWERTMRELMP